MEQGGPCALLLSVHHVLSEYAVRKKSHIDYWKLTENFKRGDFVQRINFKFDLASPYYGLVTAVHRGIGFLDVQWPWGNERMSPEDVIRVNPANVQGLPPTVDTSYDSFDIAKSRLDDGTSVGYSYAKPWVGPLGTPQAVVASSRRIAAAGVAFGWVKSTLRTAAAQAFHRGLGEDEAVKEVVASAVPMIPRAVAESAVRRFYRGAEKVSSVVRDPEGFDEKKASIPNPNNDAQRIVDEVIAARWQPMGPGYIEWALRESAEERENEMLQRYLAVDGYIDTVTAR